MSASRLCLSEGNDLFFCPHEAQIPLFHCWGRLACLSQLQVLLPIKASTCYREEVELFTNSRGGDGQREWEEAFYTWMRFLCCCFHEVRNMARLIIYKYFIKGADYWRDLNFRRLKITKLIHGWITMLLIPNGKYFMLLRSWSFIQLVMSK